MVITIILEAAFPPPAKAGGIHAGYLMNLSEQKLTYLKTMGIQAWQWRTSPSSELPEIRPNEPSWENLRQCVQACTACGLAQSRTQTVFGVGNISAKLMIIGEAPGFYEDKQGEPFVGRAGQLLNAMLQAIGLERNSVYIANILKCRPPNNRDPSPEEVSTCTPFLEKQIQLVKPMLLLAVGRIAAHYLLHTKSSMTQLRGKQYQYQHIPLIVTFHPAYLLRNPSDKSKAFADLQLVKKLLL